MSNDPVQEQELEHRQGALYPVGRSLRTTFGPPEDEVLQPAITSLMVELSHQPFDDRDALTPPRPASASSSPSVLLALVARLLHR